MREYVRLTPLTAEERLFSEENYQILERYLRKSQLDQDLHDIAYLGYLHAVKKWHTQPGLQKWTFQTIMKQTIRSYLGNESRKMQRRIQTISLEERIAGTEGLTYADTITEENVRFLYKMEDFHMETKRKINYDIEIPDIAKISRNTKVSVDTELLVNFLGSNHKNMCIEYFDKKEADKKARNFRYWKRSHKREDFKIFRFEEKVYIEKIAKGKGAK